MTIVTLPNQSVLDIALQYTGTADSALEIAYANEVPVDYTFDEAAEIIIPDSLYKPQSVVPCTGELAAPQPLL
jgi:hypothetical protein